MVGIPGIGFYRPPPFCLCRGGGAEVSPHPHPVHGEGGVEGRQSQCDGDSRRAGRPDDPGIHIYKGCLTSGSRYTAFPDAVAIITMMDSCSGRSHC